MWEPNRQKGQTLIGCKLKPPFNWKYFQKEIGSLRANALKGAKSWGMQEIVKNIRCQRCGGGGLAPVPEATP